MEQSEQRMQQSYKRGEYGKTPQPDFAFETNMTMVDHVRFEYSHQMS